MLINKRIRNIYLRSLFVVIEMLIILCLAGCRKDQGEQVSVDTNTLESTENDVSSSVQIESTEALEGDGGGNQYYNDSEKAQNIVSILISEDKYYYDNKPIQLEEIIFMIEKMDGEIIVEIMDDNATLKAYRELEEKLSNMEVSIVNK